MPSRSLTFFLLSVVATAALAEELKGTIQGKASERIAIAIPPAVIEGGLASSAGEVADVIRNDLDFTGFYAVLDPSGEGRLSPQEQQDPKAWGGVGAQDAVLISLRPEGDRALVRVRVIETGAGETLLDRSWVGSLATDLRRLAHTAANSIHERLTGARGIFLTRIAYVARVGNAKEVFLMDYDGHRARQLTHNGAINLLPAWAPDARTLAYVSFKNRRPSFFLLTEEGVSSNLKLAAGDLNQSPDWSPSGTSLAFTSDRDGNSELYRYDLLSNHESRLTASPTIDTAPVWSPTGEQLAFTSDRSGTPQIYLMRADGTDVRRLTFEGNYNDSAAWSPDGGRIAFASRIEGSFQLVLHDLASGRELALTSGKGNKENPRWAPDGHHLVFSSNMNGIYSLYSIRDDGTDLRRLTQGTEAEAPDWSPLER